MAAVTMAASSLTLLLVRCPNPQPSPSLLRFSSPFSCFLPSSASIFSSHFHAPLSAFPLTSSGSKRTRTVHAIAEEEERTATIEDRVEDGGEVGVSHEARARLRPCELYVCNLPRSCDVSQLLDLFKPYGILHSVEISRDSETGISRGCGYITMSSIKEAKAAIASLDGSDLGGRELRVKFSADMVTGRKNAEALNTAPKKDIVFESPHKVYVGNLAWSVRPEDLREHFSQFGTVVSTRVLYDRKGGKTRVYGFLSFSSADELKAAMETSGSVFHGRTLLVREVINREEQ
ncbi:28 kDa ribonucleoprotein, chloroplastic isoform X2 [Elaeis guineensis]|uniref:28 kDa ribonucleoprotein, chloroplastic n=1 Tax=Elaeis guineensis var. tenera TaxID=51953 RepID=A0A6I9QK72_ELAGV|nr:28 kDa ribonucleoprotein, chloroplastic [Elaeis guineensis]